MSHDSKRLITCWSDRTKRPSHWFLAFIGVLAVASVQAGDIYWSAANRSTSEGQASGYLVRANADGTNASPVLSSTALRTVWSSLPDASTGKLYWTFRDGSVHRADLDGTNIETIVPSSPAYTLSSIRAIDSSNGKIYLEMSSSSYGSDFARTNLDGSGGLEVLISHTVTDAGDYMVDLTANKVYWLKGVSSNLTNVYRADLTGANQELIFPIDSQYASLIGIEATEGKLYWFGRNNCVGNIRRSDLDGSNTETLVPLTNCPRGFALDSVSQKLYWSTIGDGVQRVTRSNLDGSLVEVFLSNTHADYYSALSIDESNGKLYWSGGYDLRRISVDGTSREYNLTQLVVEPAGVALDPGSNHIYWVDIATGTIMRSDMSGLDPVVLISEPELIPPATVANYGVVRIKRDIKLDPTAGKMYWTTYYAIHRSNLDGSNIELVLSTGINEPVGLSLDLNAGKIYWTEVFPQPNVNIAPRGHVVRANLDGTGAEVITTDDLIAPAGIDLHSTTGKLFWVNSLSYVELYGANLDGSDSEALTHDGLGVSQLLAVDVGTEHVYLANASRITRFNLDGSDQQVIESAFGPPIGIALDTPLCELTYAYGDVNYSGGNVNLDDILCLLSGFANAASCPGGDIRPCYQNGVIDLNDILSVLEAFAGNSQCSDRCAP